MSGANHFVTEARDWLQLGKEAISEGDFANAMKFLHHAVLLKPDDAGARVALGFALIEEKFYIEAKPQLSRAIMLDPANADAYYLLGKASMEMRDWSEAVENFEEAFDLNPRFETALRDLSRAFFESGQKERAREAILKGVELFPDSADFHYYLGNLYLDDRKSGHAITCYEKALSIDPGYAEVHNNIGHAFLDQCRVDQAIASLRQALSLRPAYLEAHDNLLWAMLFQTEGGGSAYLTEARSFGAKTIASAVPFASWPAGWRKQPVVSRGYPLRVGLVSGDFRAHAVGYLLEGILPHVNPARIELVSYSMNPHDDVLTGRIRPCFTEWTSIAGLGDEEAARKIHEDGVDILIDLSGHSGHNRQIGRASCRERV